jgi:hypothetical protein
MTSVCIQSSGTERLEVWIWFQASREESKPRLLSTTAVEVVQGDATEILKMILKWNFSFIRCFY